MGIKHKFVSTKSDGADASLVRPSDWNDTHEIEEKSISVSHLVDSTAGRIITWGPDGVATVVLTGASGQVLTSNGPGTAPTFQTPSGGGGITFDVTSPQVDDFLLYNGSAWANFAKTSILNKILPSQTSNTNKVLTTNGSTASWQNPLTIGRPVSGGALGEVLFQDGSQNLASSSSFLFTAGKLGVGISPAAKAHVVSTSEQLRLGYNSSEYVSFTVGSAGNVHVLATSSGKDPEIFFDNIIRVISDPYGTEWSGSDKGVNQGAIYTKIENMLSVGAAKWGAITGTLSSQSDLQSALNGKEPTISAGTTSQYYRGDKSWQTLDTASVSGLTSALAGKEPSISAGTTSQYYRGDKSWQTLDTAAVSGLTSALAGKEPTVAPGTTAQYYRGDKTWQTLPAGGGMTIGDTVTGGTADRVLFVNGSGNLAQDADLTFNGTMLQVGGSGTVLANSAEVFKIRTTTATGTQNLATWTADGGMTFKNHSGTTVLSYTLANGYFSTGIELRSTAIIKGSQLYVNNNIILSAPNATTFFAGSAPGGSYTGSNNTCIGYNTGTNLTVQHSNVLVGDGAGGSASGDSYFNVYVGRNAGAAATSRNNVMLGYNAGTNTTTGEGNIFIGSGAGSANTTGTGMLLIGSGAGANASVNNLMAIGGSAGYSNTSGVENTYVGLLSGYSNVTGEYSTYIGARTAFAGGTHQSYCTVIGYSSGYSNAGYFNTYIGASAGSSATSGWYNVAVGYNCQLDSNTSDNQTNINNTFIATATTARIQRPDFSVRYSATQLFQMTISSAGLVTMDITGTNPKFAFNQTVKFNDGINLELGTTSGSSLGGSSSQKLSLWGATPIVQPTTSVAQATFDGKSSGIVNDSATFDGYTLGQVVRALRNAGILA